MTSYLPLWPYSLLFVGTVVLGVASCASQQVGAADQLGAAPGQVREQSLQIPLADASGAQYLLQARVCYPATTSGASARLVSINHGSPPSASARPTMRLGRCDQEAAQWFTKRGYAVVFALRRGYGATGGNWAESYGGCARADYVHAGLETARDIAAVVDHATTLPGIRPDGAVVVGQSAGGWGTIAYNSQPHPKVAAFVVMAGGRGGHEDSVPNQNCHPEQLAEAAGRFGATASTPMLWIYAANDSYFAPQVADALHHAFTGAGGKAELERPGPYDGDGHRLFFGPGGSAVWGPMIERYLTQQGVSSGP